MDGCEEENLFENIIKTIKFNKFFEGKLEFGDLIKSKYGRLRGNILIDKIKEGIPVELINGDKITVTQILDVKTKEYVDINSDLNPLSQITDESGNFSPEKSRLFSKL